MTEATLNPDFYTVGEVEVAEKLAEEREKEEHQGETKSIIGKLKEKTHNIKDKLTKNKKSRSRAPGSTTTDADKQDGSSSSSSSDGEEDAQDENNHETMPGETGSSGRQATMAPMFLLPSHGHDDKCAACGVQHHDTKLEAGEASPPPNSTGGPAGHIDNTEKVKSMFDNTETGLPIGHIDQGSSSNLEQAGESHHKEGETYKGGMSESISSKPGGEPQPFEGSRGLPSPENRADGGAEIERTVVNPLFAVPKIEGLGDKNDQHYAGDPDTLGQKDDKKADNVHDVNVGGSPFDQTSALTGSVSGDFDAFTSDVNVGGSPFDQTSALTGSVSGDFDAFTSVSGNDMAPESTYGKAQIGQDEGVYREYQTGEPRSSQQDRSAADVPTENTENTEGHKGFLAIVTDKAKHLLGVGGSSDAAASTDNKELTAHKHGNDILGKMIDRDLAGDEAVNMKH